jgi:hypothetical protein
MTVPDWRTSTAGSRVRAALWLHSEVGRGGVFTKAQLRAAFPGVEQIDRRVRDLRAEGWIIATRREDPSLDREELRLVAEGGPVWERGYRSRQEGQVSDQQRRAALAAANFTCVYCGVASGEPYPDDELRTAKLSASRILDRDRLELVTLCDRCRAGGANEPVDDGLPDEVDKLSDEQRRRLRSWLVEGKRDWNPEERLWARYRRLSPARQEEIRSILGVR